MTTTITTNKSNITKTDTSQSHTHSQKREMTQVRLSLKHGAHSGKNLGPQNKVKKVYQRQEKIKNTIKIQRILGEFRGIKNISCIESAKKRVLIPKTAVVLPCARRASPGFQGFSLDFGIVLETSSWPSSQARRRRFAASGARSTLVMPPGDAVHACLRVGVFLYC